MYICNKFPAYITMNQTLPTGNTGKCEYAGGITAQPCQYVMALQSTFFAV